MSNVLAWISGSGVVQGVIIGAALSFLAAILILGGVTRTITTTVNGWSAIRRAGQPGNGVFVRGASAMALPVVNSFEEAAYWRAARDDSGQALSGEHEYVMHFSSGGLPPTDAFWSLTPTDTAGFMVSNPTNRYSVGTRTGLAANSDGSVDVHLGGQEPAGRDQNWLPTPQGKFKLMFRVYLPGAAIVDGSYQVPRVVRER